MQTASSIIKLNPPVSLPALAFVSSTCHRHSKVYGIRFPVGSESEKGFQSVVYGVRCSSPRGGAVNVEKDWSFLDFEDGGLKGKIERIISGGNLKKTSKVLVSYGSEGFIDEVVSAWGFEFLVHVHDSLMILASVKEKYDEIKCWQGEVVNIPDKWSDFDAVYLYFLPGIPLQLDQLLAALATRCSPGARVVISYPGGKSGVEELKERFPDVVLWSLPDRTRLLQAAAKYSFQLVEFVDEPQFYLSVLTLNAAT